MVLVAYAGPVRPAAALRDSVLCLPTDINSLFVKKRGIDCAWRLKANQPCSTWHVGGEFGRFTCRTPFIVYEANKQQV